MLKTIGSDWFTVSHEGTIDGAFSQLNQYLIRSKNGNSKEFLYLYEDQVNELIELLQKVKELL
jgi:hypothetical protein